jgi:hypothetical protein
MIKKILLVTGLVAIIGLLIFGAVNRTLAKNDNETIGQGGNGRNSEAWSVSGTYSGDENQGRRGGKGGQGGNAQYGQDEAANLPPAQPGDLTVTEADALLYMREEEKLAHDVYVTLYDQWGLNTFQNIAGSEQTHTNAVKTLLDRYDLEDPASDQVGVFSNSDLQALYNRLTARGSQSLAEAIKVGAAIEEIDILDLEERLTQADNADLRQVFNNLLNGSKNHLRAFASALQAQSGETYQPQYLSAEAYQSILGGANIGNSRGGNAGSGYGRGGQDGQGGQRGGRGQNRGG